MSFSTMRHDTAPSPIVNPDEPVRGHRHRRVGVVPQTSGEKLAARKDEKQRAAHGGTKAAISGAMLKSAALALPPVKYADIDAVHNENRNDLAAILLSNICGRC
jgi:hypothetical protein